MWNAIIEFCNLNNILVLPSSKGSVIPETVVDDRTQESQPNWAELSPEELCAQLEPLLPDGYRVELLPESDDYDSGAIFIGKARTIVDRNRVAFSKMPM